MTTPRDTNREEAEAALEAMLKSGNTPYLIAAGVLASWDILDALDRLCQLIDERIPAKRKSPEPKPKPNPAPSPYEDASRENPSGLSSEQAGTPTPPVHYHSGAPCDLPGCAA